MKGVPRNAGMNQKEFDQFIQELDNYGFVFKPEKISENFAKEVGIFADNAEEHLKDLLHYDNIYSRFLEYVHGRGKGPVYCDGKEINMSNVEYYSKWLPERIDFFYGLVDELLVQLNKDIGLKA